MLPNNKKKLRIKTIYKTVSKNFLVLKIVNNDFRQKWQFMIFYFMRKIFLLNLILD